MMVSELRTPYKSKRTQDEVPDSFIVKQWPRQAALGENLDATDRERVNIHGREKFAVATRHQLRRLPSEGPICR